MPAARRRPCCLPAHLAVSKASHGLAYHLPHGHALHERLLQAARDAQAAMDKALATGQEEVEKVPRKLLLAAVLPEFWLEGSVPCCLPAACPSCAGSGTLSCHAMQSLMQS